MPPVCNAGFLLQICSLQDELILISMTSSGLFSPKLLKSHRRHYTTAEKTVSPQCPFRSCLRSFWSFQIISISRWCLPRTSTLKLKWTEVLRENENMDIYRTWHLQTKCTWCHQTFHNSYGWTSGWDCFPHCCFQGQQWTERLAAQEWIAQ